MLCYLAGMEPYYLKCIKDGPFLPKTADGDAKPKLQWTPDERRVVVQDQRLKSIIMSCLPDDIMKSIISCVLAKETWTYLVHSFEGLVAEIFDWDEEEVSDDEEVTRVNVLMALADDELTVRKKVMLEMAFRVYNTRRQQIEETYHVTFDESRETIRFTNNSVDEIGINDSFRYPLDEFLREDDPSRQYQVNSDISYYVIPHGRSFTELTHENHIPKDNQMITQPTNVPSGNNNEVLRPITEPLVPDVTQSHIPNQASTSSYLSPQDRWSRDQHIEHVNIIGNPRDGMLIICIATSASECLFFDFQFEIKPKKVSEALKHLGWIDAMQEELNQFYKNKVWTFVPLPYGKIAIRSKWVFKNKKDENGTTTKNKARLVAQGYSHKEGIDYDETFTPVARMEAIRIFLAFATYMNFKVYQIDVKSALLNGKLKEKVYVKQPSSFESSEFPDYVCKLDKALYGLKQAPRAWYETLSTFLIQNKFAKGRMDNTLFIYKSKGYVLLVQVYANDIIFGSTSYKLCKQFEKLTTKKFEISMMGELTYFLGLQIKQDVKGILICQEQYTKNLLTKYDISDSSSMKTLMVPPNNLGLDLAGKPNNETSYKGMIGSLMYLTATRLNIQFSTVLCARYQSNPKESHLIAVKRILRYLKGTLTLGLYYLKCLGFDLKGYSDSYYAGCNMDRKSTSAKAEYVVAAGCCASILWMKSQLSDYDSHYKMVPISCCNTIAIAISNNPVLGGNYSSTKQVYSIQQLLACSLITGTEVEIREIIYSDLVTKLLNKSRLKYVSYPKFISCALQVLLGHDYTQDKKFEFLPPIMSNFNFTTDPSKVTKNELTAHMITVNNQRDSVSPPPLVAKQKKGKSQTVTSTSPKSQGLEASGTLFKKSKRPMCKKPPTETKVTSPKPTDGFEKSHSVSSGTVPNPQDLKRDIQLTSTRLPSTLDEGTRMARTMSHLEGLRRDKYLGGNKPPTDMEPQNPIDADLSGTGAKYKEDQTQSSRLRYQSMIKNEFEPSYKREPNTQPMVLTYADVRAILFSEYEAQESEKDILGADEEMDDNPQSAKTQHQPSPPGQSSLAPASSVTLTFSLTDTLPNIEGENATQTATKEPLSHTEGETNTNIQDKPKERKQSTDANIEFIGSSTHLPSITQAQAITIINPEPSIPQREGKGIATDDQAKDQRKLVKASFIVRPDPDEPVRFEFMINEKIVYLTEQEIQEYWDKEEEIKKAEEEAKVNAISNTEVIKVVREEAKKLSIHLKEAITTKAGKLFKKAQEAEHEVLKRQHTNKVRKSLKHRKHKNSDVHKPFLFGTFGISELDELREIIRKKKNTVVKDLMNSLIQRYERLRQIPRELRIQSALHAPEQASSQTSGRKRKHMELEPETRIRGLECNRTLPENSPFVNNMVIEEPEYGIFFTDKFGDQAFQRWSDINKVGVEALVSYLVAASMVPKMQDST
uniref:Retrovirus-related Pol polyprotein from transposon TNT 1-94 n=1 Tax=Tanacetum cinerariifolium TaxID=118510 RepID=A0A6L2KLL4_TANCI|nr:retrovirus-related Pol polyprotein from transposon TNT 1-94 [Tanacetum cinerariifolium]